MPNYPTAEKHQFTFDEEVKTPTHNFAAGVVYHQHLTPDQWEAMQAMGAKPARGAASPPAKPSKRQKKIEQATEHTE